MTVEQQWLQVQQCHMETMASSYCQCHSSSSWLQLPAARHKIEEVSCEAAQLHALSSTYMSAVVGVYFISLPCFFIRMHGINVLLPAGLVINERTLKYFAVCFILACTLHTWKLNTFLVTWYSFFPTFTLCQFCWNLCMDCCLKTNC